MSTTTDKLYKNKLEAEDVLNLQEHIGWVEIIKPELIKYKRICETQLAGVVLGFPTPNEMDQALTAEQLAGRAYGIAWTIDLFEAILRKGDNAIKVLYPK